MLDNILRCGKILLCSLFGHEWMHDSKCMSCHRCGLLIKKVRSK